MVSFILIHFLKNSNDHILSKTILPISLLLCDNLPLVGFFIYYVNDHILVIHIVLLDHFKKKLCMMYTKVIVFYLLCGLLVIVKKIPFSEISLTFILVLLPVSVPNLLWNLQWHISTFLLCTLASWDGIPPTHTCSLQPCRVT